MTIGLVKPSSSLTSPLLSDDQFPSMFWGAGGGGGCPLNTRRVTLKATGQPINRKYQFRKNNFRKNDSSRHSRHSAHPNRKRMSTIIYHCLTFLLLVDLKKGLTPKFERVLYCCIKLYCIKLAFSFTVYVFGACLRMLAVILVPCWGFVCF